MFSFFRLLLIVSFISGVVLIYGICIPGRNAESGDLEVR